MSRRRPKGVIVERVYEPEEAAQIAALRLLLEARKPAPASRPDGAKGSEHDALTPGTH